LYILRIQAIPEKITHTNMERKNNRMLKRAKTLAILTLAILAI